MFPPDLLRYIASFNYSVDMSLVCSEWSKTLSIKAIQNSHGLEFADRPRTIGLRTKSAEIRYQHMTSKFPPHLNTLRLEGGDNFNSMNISELHELQVVLLHGMHVGNIDKLVECKQIHTLHLNCVSISNDISKLADMTQLQTLYLRMNGRVNFSWLRQMTQLRSLHIHVHTEDISWLKDMVNLESLSVDGYSNFDVAWLHNYVALKCLRISSVRVEHWELLKEPLETLSVSFVQGITEIPYLPNLENLYVEGSNVNISSITRLHQLKELKFVEHKESVTDVSDLRNLHNLETLFIELPFDDLSWIRSLQKLIKLTISNYTSGDINALSSLLGLRELSISNCDNISDLTPISHSRLTCLSLVEIYPHVNFTCLQNIQSLREIYIRNNKVMENSQLNWIVERGIIYRIFSLNNT